MTRPLGGHHGHVDVGRRGDEPEADVEAVGEEDGVTGAEVGGDLRLVHGGLLGVGQQDHDDVRLGGGIGTDRTRRPGLFRLLPRRGALPQAHADVDPALRQVEGVGVALGAVADDRHLAVPDEARVGILLVVQRGHRINLPSLCRVRRGFRQVERRAVAGPVKHRQRHPAGPLHLDDAVAADEVLEVVQLPRRALQRHGEPVVADVDDLALEHPDQLDDLAAGLGGGLERGQEQFALAGHRRVELGDRHHRDQLVQLLDDLVQRRRLDVHDDGDPAEPLVVRRGDGQA